MSKASDLIFNDMMDNVKIIYDDDSFAYAKTDDIKAYLEKLTKKLNQLEE